MKRATGAWVLCAVAGAVLISALSSREQAKVGEAVPAAADARSRVEPTTSTRLAPVKPAIEEERVEATLRSPEPQRLPQPPRESVKAKLERLRPQMLRSDGEPSAGFDDDIQRIEQLILAATQEELEYRFAHRIGVETLGADQGATYTAEGFDPTAVYWVRFTPGGPTEKVSLPRDEFPEIYALKAESALLRTLRDEPGLSGPGDVEQQ